MTKQLISTQMKVKENLVNVIREGNIDYISLTDLAKYKNPKSPGDVIIKWMSNKSSFDFYYLWEELFNEDFKLAESREFKKWTLLSAILAYKKRDFRPSLIFYL